MFKKLQQISLVPFDFCIPGILLEPLSCGSSVMMLRKEELFTDYAALGKSFRAIALGLDWFILLQLFGFNVDFLAALAGWDSVLVYPVVHPDIPSDDFSNHDCLDCWWDFTMIPGILGLSRREVIVTTYELH